MKQHAHLAHWDRERRQVVATCGARSTDLSPVLSEVVCHGCHMCHRRVRLAIAYRRKHGLPPLQLARLSG